MKAKQHPEFQIMVIYKPNAAKWLLQTSIAVKIYFCYYFEESHVFLFKERNVKVLFFKYSM
jgi:hypothetical protein